MVRVYVRVTSRVRPKSERRGTGEEVGGWGVWVGDVNVLGEGQESELALAVDRRFHASINIRLVSKKELRLGSRQVQGQDLGGNTKGSGQSQG